MEALRRGATELCHEDYVVGIQTVQAKKKSNLNYYAWLDKSIFMELMVSIVSTFKNKKNKLKIFVYYIKLWMVLKEVKY